LRGGRGCVTVLFSTHRIKSGAIQTTARHCERSAAIAHTTDRRSAPATASCLAVTAANGDRDAPPRGSLHRRYHNTPPTPSQEGRAERRSTDRGNTGSHLITNKGACPLAERPLAKRGEATHPVRDGSSVENPYAAPLASRTGCNINGRRQFLPNSHSSRNADTTARHCERSAAIAQTTDKRCSSATASCLAVTASIQTNNSNHMHSFSPSHGGGWGEAKTTILCLNSISNKPSI
jgi:hypothetical protein